MGAQLIQNGVLAVSLKLSLSFSIMIPYVVAFHFYKVE